MKRTALFMKLFLGSILLLGLLCSCTGPSSPSDATATPGNEETDPRVFQDSISGVQPDPNKHLNVKLLDEGYDIYAPTAGGSYRYGPTMINYPDGSIDAWFATPGELYLEWDWFTYKHSPDGGETWSDEIVVLQPTPDSMDFYSVCDPGIIYFNGYYYMGYTSTIHGSGMCNNGFVARSKNPDGPYEKWNGNGWGGNPQPIVYYTDDKNGWGAGEMSFVELDGTLYIYYTWSTASTSTTRVSIADASDENWPATMEYKGIAMEHQAGSQDSADVKYVEDYGKFIAINTGNRFTENSYLGIWESNDGLTFTLVNKLRTNVMDHCHNAGLMGRTNGHINLKDPLMLGYAYGNSQEAVGNWAARFHEFSLELVEEIDMSDAKNEANTQPFQVWTHEELWPIALTTIPHHIEKALSKGAFEVDLFWVDTMSKRHAIEDVDNVTFSDYDQAILEFEGLVCTPKAVGRTFVTASYEGRSVTFLISIRENGAKINMKNPAIVEWKSALCYPMTGPIAISENGDITISRSNKKDKVQLRAMAIFEDENWMELFNDQSTDTIYAADSYPVEYSGFDGSILRISKTGVVTPKAVGTTSVTVSCNGFHYTVNITVTE